MDALMAALVAAVLAQVGDGLMFIVPARAAVGATLGSLAVFAPAAAMASATGGCCPRRPPAASPRLCSCSPGWCWAWGRFG